MSLTTVILAAGKGTRMRSALPKVLHPIAGKPMVQHVIDKAQALGATKTNLVYGHGGELLQDAVKTENLNWVLTRGTVRNRACCCSNQRTSSLMTILFLILYGDVPLTKQETLEKLLSVLPERGLAVLTVNLINPMGYGRMIRENGKFSWYS